MVNDIKAVSLSTDLSKFADDIAIIAPVYDYEDSAGDEVENMKLWSNENRMSLNMEKTYEMIVRGKVSTPLPDHIPSIKRKEWLKLLGVTMEVIPVEVWGGASYNKYVSQIDKFVNRAYRNGYTSNRSDFKATISNRDKKLWSRIINDDKNALRNLLPRDTNLTERQKLGDRTGRISLRVMAEEEQYLVQAASPAVPQGLDHAEVYKILQ
ncbi:Hypothetical predicted protein [Paramuricea clavata]|uniref:Uncharacterized protein n=1 Tax=Paramuricea clavata TaxID=317549 RepID=A0A6S7K3F5_PARCT|nr:Hypothetical predicted protein [Paramuricea clavata]